MTPDPSIEEKVARAIAEVEDDDCFSMELEMPGDAEGRALSRSLYLKYARAALAAHQQEPEERQYTDEEADRLATKLWDCEQREERLMAGNPDPLTPEEAEALLITRVPPDSSSRHYAAWRTAIPKLRALASTGGSDEGEGG